MSPTGAIIMGVFGAIWCALALSAAIGSVAVSIFAPALVAAVICAFAVMVARRSSARSDAEGKRIGRIIGIASAAEGVAILVVVNVLANIGQSGLTAPAVAAIVALHFVPIAWATPYPLFYLLAVLMLAVAGASVLVPASALRMEIVGFGSALLLWAASALALARSGKLDRATTSPG